MQIGKMIRSFAVGCCVAVTGLFAVSTSAVAAPVVLTGLTDQIDMSTTSTAILAVAAALCVVYITWKAAGLVIGALRRL